MAKKNSKKNNKDKNPLPESSPSTRGGFLFVGTLFLLLSLFTYVDGSSSSNLFGLLGYTFASILHYLFGFSSYLIILFSFWFSWRLMLMKPPEALFNKGFWLSIAVFSGCITLSLVSEYFWDFFHTHFSQSIYSEVCLHPSPKSGQLLRYYLGGVPAHQIYIELPDCSLRRLINDGGVLFLSLSTFILSICQLLKLPLLQLFGMLWQSVRTIQWQWHPESNPSGGLKRFVRLKGLFTSPSETTTAEKTTEVLAIQPSRELTVRPTLSKKQSEEPRDIRIPAIELSLDALQKRSTFKRDARQIALKEQRVYSGDFKEYQFPAQTLLTKPAKVDQSSLKGELKKQAEVLEETLHSFGIEAKVGQINCGPTITSFEVHPSIGVKVQKICSLEHDIALNMEAKSIRIIAPIPGKAAVGIEVPNPRPQEVGFTELMSSYQQSGKSYHIPLLLGKTVTGDYVINDLAKMPHCIIAGATGSGKSVCINTIIMSILMTARPDEIKLMMVDPKKVELTPYNNLPHLIAPVITEPQGACSALNWLVKEMEKRYEILKQVGVRNIASFNSRKADKKVEEALAIEIPEKLSYIVGIIDELADLMMVASNDIETPIARIAQMARAVGIHLILATQRPSREVITGIIKANFPARIAFKVASRVNSQIILDETGAESLLGNGDMLFLPPGTSTLTRAQGAYVRDEDIQKVVERICEQAPPNYLIESFDDMAAEDSNDASGGYAKRDRLFEDAVNIVQESGNASTTFLQRKLKIGYARAATLMDQLKEEGIVGSSEGTQKGRKAMAGVETFSDGKKGNKYSKTSEDYDY